LTSRVEVTGFYALKDTIGWGVLLAVLAPPHPRGAINRAPTPVAIAALGFL
jgi:hypothetical protein